MRYESGEKVVSIDNEFDCLTYYKVYTVLRSIGGCILIQDDTNIVHSYYCWRFISMKEYRKQKLKKLNENR